MEGHKEDTRQCPFCGETIKAEAKKCRFCGQWLDDTQQEKNTNENNNKDLSIIRQSNKNTLFKKHPILLILFWVMMVITFIINFVEQMYNNILPYYEIGWLNIIYYRHYKNVIFVPTVITTLLGIAWFYKLYGNNNKFNGFGKLILSIAHAITITQFLCFITSFAHGLYVSILIKRITEMPGISGLTAIAIFFIFPNVLALIIASIFSKRNISAIKNKLKSLISKKIISIILVILVTSGIIASIVKLNDTFSLPKCDSQFAEEQVIQIYQENSSFYKYYANRGLIRNLHLRDQVPVSYDKSLHKYTCQGNIFMEHAVYTNKIHSVPVMYFIFKSHGKNTVLVKW